MKFAQNPTLANSTPAGPLEAASKGYTDGLISGLASIYRPILAPLSVKTADYTLTDSDEVVIFDTNAAARTCTLPTAVGRAGKTFTVKKLGPVNNNYVMMATTSSQTIDGGSASLFIIANSESYRFISDGTNWHTIGGQRPLTAIYTSPANAGTLTIDSASQSTARVSTTVAGFTLAVPNNGLDGFPLNVEINPTNAFTLTLHASILLMSGMSASLVAAAGKRVFVGLRRTGGSWYCLAQGVQA